MTCEAIIAGKFVAKVRPLIDEAAHSLDICVFDWRWYAHEPASLCQLFNQAIIQASKRGVEVRAIVNNEYVVSVLRQAGVQVKKFQSAHLLHSKLMIIDQKILITGSHNYTQSAFNSNYELSVILRDVVGISEYSDFFQHLWSR